MAEEFEQSPQSEAADDTPNVLSRLKAELEVMRREGQSGRVPDIAKFEQLLNELEGDLNIIGTKNLPDSDDTQSSH